MMRTVLVTGASGFVGRQLVPALRDSGWTVRAACRDPKILESIDAIETVALPDLGEPVDWAPLLDGMTHVVHLAGVAHVPVSEEDARYDRINTGSVAALGEAAKAANVQRAVLMSSVRAQVGLSADHPITEADDPQPTDPYGRSKLAAEAALKASGVEYTILRPAVVYGPGVKGNIASLASLARTPMPLPFDGLKNRRSLLAIENLIAAVELALTDEAARNETFLVADKDPISVAGLVSAMREGLGRQPHLVGMPLGAVKRIMKSFGREADWDRISGNFMIDSSKLQGIGWDPKIETREGIMAMMAAEGATQKL
ncbi:3 beta-hydroxysteroid dehydrogenase/Delta 5--_4-isomerase [Methyloligella halotolerans]|uniref:3 beta-hydroxysteroid dehydrogenase/Delta 5-->4-isomerase n=1 Tax=Methyloligella halotolerans TaxID=1177755 RepID=A0A1E2RYQ3_9HYPH|nr:NAD-dependent epimerase/dehydratase family protein [Methyloligella halotolerans]ODA67179.1 3 beta-hydroxysteroid dehydrogenase/Delta 5-->4-isomerase [Methyloligella halotolerans]